MLGIVNSDQLPKSYVYFGIRGDFDAGKLAADIPLDPVECVTKHSRNPLRELPRTSIVDYCRIESDSSLVDIYDLAERVVAHLEPHQDQIRTAISSYLATANLQVVLYFPMSEEISTPIFGFSERVIRFLGKVGASIDIDSYRA